MIAILGAGQMGEALTSGLLRAGVVSPAEITAAARRSERAEQLRVAYGIEVLSAARAAEKAETLLIAAAGGLAFTLLGHPAGGRDANDDFTGHRTHVPRPPWLSYSKTTVLRIDPRPSMLTSTTSPSAR